MHRPRWHDWVIVLSLVALTVAGTAALWGEDIARWIGDEEPAERQREPDGEPPAGGGRLL